MNDTVEVIGNLIYLKSTSGEVILRPDQIKSINWANTKCCIKFESHEINYNPAASPIAFDRLIEVRTSGVKDFNDEEMNTMAVLIEAIKKANEIKRYRNL